MRVKIKIDPFGLEFQAKFAPRNFSVFLLTFNPFIQPKKSVYFAYPLYFQLSVFSDQSYQLSVVYSCLEKSGHKPKSVAQCFTVFGCPNIITYYREV